MVLRRHLAAVALAVAALLFPLACRSVRVTQNPSAIPVGKVGENTWFTPTNQVLTPAGRRIDLPGLRPQALRLSPDGAILVTSGKTSRLYVADPKTGQLLQTIELPGGLLDPTRAAEENGLSSAESTAGQAETDPEARLSLTGLAFSPDGKRLYLSDVQGSVKVFSVAGDRSVAGVGSIPLPDAGALNRSAEIPAGIAVSPDGSLLYVAGNLGNRLLEIDAATGAIRRQWEVGVAPFDVVLTEGKVYVSNLGGRLPAAEQVTGPAGRGTRVRVDPVRHIANEGSVSVIDLSAGKVVREIVTGLHASGLAVSPDSRYVVVANAGSDTLSVIDTSTDEVVEKIWARQSPADLFGAQPNALAFDDGGKKLFVCNGTQNAVAVFQFEPEEKESRLLGLIPVGWFPGAVAYSNQLDTICVANLKGIGVARQFEPGETMKTRTRDFFGTLSLVKAPDDRTLHQFSRQALRNMRYPFLKAAGRPARPGRSARPVPERVGEPSKIKYVVYVIKENRTYDQILGDVPEGNGDADLCTFGEEFTPNQHKLVREFVLLDNTYCSGVQSADGHQWTNSSIANEYIERQLTADFPRSYPGGKAADDADALAWASSGFIWDNALAHGVTFRNYGEWMQSESGWSDPSREDRPTWLDFWNDFKNNSGTTRLACRPAIESLREHSYPGTTGFDLRVPDVMRARAFIQELRQFEANGGMPRLSLIFLPNDHTGGTRESYPTPGAQVADNDLALGMIVEALSRSRFWPEVALFAIEDDPQAGWDHVSGYRTTCYIAGPYAKRGRTISTNYNQTSLMRTMELILGLPPMNQLDAVATPMFDCFTDTPDLTPFTAVPNRVPLDQINPPPGEIADRILREDALVSARLPLDEVDQCPEDVFNRILWRAMKGPRTPYPEWAVARLDDDD